MTIADARAALAADDVVAVERMLDAGGDPAEELRAGGLLACRSGTMARVLVRAGADLEVASRGLGRPLQLHAGAGRLDVVAVLLEAGADRDAGNMVGNPLSAALLHGKTEVALALLASGASVSAAARFGAPLLAYACASGSVPLVRALATPAHLEERVNLGRASRLTGVPQLISRTDRVGDLPGEVVAGTAIMVSAWCGHAEAVRVLIELGARVGATDADGRNALDIAVARGHEAVAAALRAAGATSPSVEDADARLIAAVGAGDLAGARAALSEGARAGAVLLDARGGTPVLCVASERGDLPLACALLDAGADVAALCWSRGELAPLERGLRAADYQSIRDLVRAGGALDGLSWRAQCSALDLASRRGHLEVVELLLARGARSPQALLAAVIGGRVEILRRLSALFPETTRVVPAAILLAAAANQPATALEFLEAGGGHDARDLDGNTPLTFAIDHGATELVRALVSRPWPESVFKKARARAKKAKHPEILALLTGGPAGAGQPPSETVKPPAVPVSRVARLDVRRYADEAVCERLAARANDSRLRELAGWLAARTGGREHVDPAHPELVTVTPKANAKLDWEEIEREADARACTVVQIGRDPHRVSILPTEDPLDVVGLVSPADPQGDVSATTVLRFVAELHRVHGVRLRSLREDSVDLVLTRRPTLEEADALARRVCKMCPDLRETVDAASISRTGRIALWWD